MPFSLLPYKRAILGGTLPTHAEEHERLNVPAGLAIFASDALSSSAYATDEILHVFAGVAILTALQGDYLAMPIALAIIALMIIVVLSFRQLIWEYPDGGGGYMVSKKLLGVLPSLVIGAALLIDYVLTVAVSVSAGVSAMTSAFPSLVAYKIVLCIVAIWLITYLNLRGLKESARLFAFPSYLFIFSIFTLIACGWYQFTMGNHVETVIQNSQVIGQIDWTLPMAFILLKAFSSGCAALTGIEAISNGVPAFKEPSPARANTTLVYLAAILAFLFIGITSLAIIFHVTPSESQTVISQIARQVFSEVPAFYYIIQFATMLILILAANTSYSGFPRLASNMAQEGYMPRQFGIRGDKLVYSNGILFLGITSTLLIIYAQGSTHALIPLYALGVFLSFSITQIGICKHYLTFKPLNWQFKIALAFIGFITTSVITVVIAVTKFSTGAWIVLIAIPILIWMSYMIKDHYDDVNRQLELPDSAVCPITAKSSALVLVSTLHQGTIQALNYAQSIASNKVEAVHVELNPSGTEALKANWEKWGCNVPLVILPSPYRSLTEPLLNYIEKHGEDHPDEQITLIVPEFVTKKWWHRFLHNQSALAIKVLLTWNRKAVVTTYRFYLDE